MEHNFKRLLSLVIALVMIVGMIPGAAFSVFAADSVVTTETELATALAAGGTVTLGGDITTTTALTLSGVTATLDLAGHTLTLGAGDNKFIDATNLTIKNGTINISGNVTNGNAIICLDEYEKTLVTTLTLVDVDLVGEDYSSAYGIFYIGDSSVLNVQGGEWTLTNDLASAGGVFKADTSAATLNITGTKMVMHNVRRFVTYANTTIKDSTIAISGDADGVDAEMEHGFNRSPLSITNSTVTMTDMVGRGITAQNGAVTITGSTVTMSNCQEATFDVRGGQTVTVDPTSKVTVDAEPTISSGKIDGNVTVGTVMPALPTATVTELDNADLTFALKFVANEATEESAFYADWLADFELTFNKDVTMNANGGADGYLSGQYDAWSENWVNVPLEDTPLKAGETLKIMEYAAKMMGQPGLELTYADVYTGVQEFNCGVFLTEEYLAANPDLEITLELRIYNPDNKEESYVIGQTYTFTLDEEVELPTATVTKLDNKDLTFALNFLADEPTAKQLEKYGKWYADFVLTTNMDVTFNANGGANGYLSGQYDAWSENWVNVPFENVTVKANEPLKIMAYAAEMMGQPGLKVTYNDIVTSVKDFDCGVYLDDLFVCNNTDLEITLELRMFNEDETESYVIGDTYTYSIPALPTATTKEVENENLTFAMNFVADEVTEEQLDFYGDWYADFELTVNKDITLNANGGADGYLSGQYDAWSENWVNVPFENVSLKANEPLKIMAYAAELMGKPGLKYTYREVYEVVKDFDCGMFLEPEFIAANPDVEITLELKMYNPKNEANHSHVIGETYVFKFDYVAYNTVTETFYDRADDALLAAKDGETVILLKDTGANDGRTYAQLTVKEGVVFDVNGYTVTTDYMSCFGNTVDYSEANTGAVAVEPKHLLIQTDNEQVTVKTAKGFQFFEVEFVVDQVDAANNRYMFVPMLEAAAHELLAPGVATTGVTIKVDVSWKTADGHTRNQEFMYSDELVNGFIASYDPATDWYGQMFTLTLKDTTGISDLTFQAYVVSDTGVKYPA